MKPIRIDIDLAEVDPNGIFEDQTLGGAGDVILDGTEVVNGEWVTPDGFAKKIGIECAADINTVIFTITGYSDVGRHNLITDTITGINADTGESTEYFYYITSIAADSAVGTNIEGGAVDETISAVIPISWRNGITSVNLDITGTIDVSIQQTFDDIQKIDNLNFTWQDSPSTNLVNATASTNDAYVGIPTALRIKVNSYSTNARAITTIVQRNE